MVAAPSSVASEVSDPNRSLKAQVTDWATAGREIGSWQEPPCRIARYLRHRANYFRNALQRRQHVAVVTHVDHGHVLADVNANKHSTTAHEHASVLARTDTRLTCQRSTATRHHISAAGQVNLPLATRYPRHSQRRWVMARPS